MINKKYIRLFVDHNINQDGIIPLNDNQFNYLKNVMRKQISDPIIIFNGNDGQWLAEITSLKKNQAEIKAIEKQKEQVSEPDIWLVFAPIKFGKIDFLVQKATELGVSTLQPVITARTIVDRVKIERLESNAIEAAEQSERLTVPKVLPLEKLQKLLENWPEDRNIMLCDESGRGKPIKEVLSTLPKDQKWTILIGPEAGFTEEELDMLHKLPYLYPVGLGPRILRADTAAIAALSCWQEHLGDWEQAPHFI